MSNKVNSRSVKAFASAVAALLVGGGAALAQVSVDAALPEYKAVEGVSGTIKSVGSDTLNNLMTLWAEGFKKMYPNVQIEIEGKGSSTAPAALISGAATFGPMSREMKQAESDEFEKKYGYKPTPLSAGPRPLRLREPQAGAGARPAAARVCPLRLQQAGSV